MTEVARLSTGNPKADQVLGGGLPDNAITMLVGAPGTGKTLLTQQIVYANAGPDFPVVYLTTMSEPISKNIRFLQTYSFFQPDKVGDSVHYVDIGDLLGREGAGAIVGAIEGAIRDYRPRLVVIDSFKVIRDLLPSTDEMRRLMHRVGGLLSAWGATSLLVGEYTGDEVGHGPEFSVTDGIIQLLRRGSHPQKDRQLQVLKLRGCSYHEGAHAMVLSADGVTVYPRFVTPTRPREYTVYDRRLSSGNPTLDDMLGGGLWQGSTSLVMGPTGGGKTTIGLQFVVAGAIAGEQTLYANFQENPTQLRRRIRELAPDLTAEQLARIHTLYRSPVELHADSIIGSLFDLIREHEITRVVFDSLGDLLHMASELPRLHDYVYSLAEYFGVGGITALLLMETQLAPEYVESSLSRFSQMSGNVIRLEQEFGRRTERFVRVVKTRSSGHDDHRRPYRITSGGLEIERS